VGIAFVECDYVADSYIATFRDHPELELVGVHDRDERREADSASFHSLMRYRSLEQLLEDPTGDAVINRSNPASHYEVTKTCLLAGKHVYSEKPLARTFSYAAELVTLAIATRIRGRIHLLRSYCRPIWHFLLIGCHQKLDAVAELAALRPAIHAFVALTLVIGVFLVQPHAW
jgi:predicted dehydrogenase